MATFAAPSGAWTTITSLDTVGAGKGRANVPDLGNINLESLKGPLGVTLSELEQFVQFMADGYNIGFQHAWTLLLILVRAKTQAPDLNLLRVVG